MFIGMLRELTAIAASRACIIGFQCSDALLRSNAQIFTIQEITCNSTFDTIDDQTSCVVIPTDVLQRLRQRPTEAEQAAVTGTRLAVWFTFDLDFYEAHRRWLRACCDFWLSLVSGSNPCRTLKKLIKQLTWSFAPFTLQRL